MTPLAAILRLGRFSTRLVCQWLGAWKSIGERLNRKQAGIKVTRGWIYINVVYNGVGDLFR